MEDELLRGTEDRRLPPRAVGVRSAPPLTASRAPAEGRPVAAEPVAGAPGWRVTRRVAAPAEPAAGAPPRPRASTVAAPSAAPEGRLRTPERAPGSLVAKGPVAASGRSRAPERPADQAAALAFSPKRVAGAGRRGRGISLLALAAAAAVVVSVLGLAALDAQRRDLPVPWGEQAAAPAAGAALTGQSRPGGLHPSPEAALAPPSGPEHDF